MFEMLRKGHRLGAMGSRWIGCTSLDPGDRGQIAKQAARFVTEDGTEPEDAWLLSMTAWMAQHPSDDEQRRLAVCLSRFLDTYEGKIPLSAAPIVLARKYVEEILEPEDNDEDEIELLSSEERSGLDAARKAWREKWDALEKAWDDGDIDGDEYHARREELLQSHV